MSARRAAAAADTRREDSNRSLKQWQRMNLNTLQLKCNSYDLLETGKKDALARRLFNYFNYDSSSSDDSSSSSPPSDDDSDGDERPRSVSPTRSGAEDADARDDENRYSADQEEMNALLAPTIDDGFLFPT